MPVISPVRQQVIIIYDDNPRGRDRRSARRRNTRLANDLPPSILLFLHRSYNLSEEGGGGGGPLRCLLENQKRRRRRERAFVEPPPGWPRAPNAVNPRGGSRNARPVNYVLFSCRKDRVQVQRSAEIMTACPWRWSIRAISYGGSAVITWLALPPICLSRAPINELPVFSKPNSRNPI